jgi:hypothetical protein
MQKTPPKLPSCKAFQQSIKLDAAIVPEAYVGLAGALSSLGRYGEAADALASYMKAAPDIKNREAIDRKIQICERRLNRHRPAPQADHFLCECLR